MPEPTRDELLALIDRAWVPQEHWRNRDSQDAQKQLGEAYALLKAGCDFQIDRSPDLNRGGRTVWVHIQSQGFDYFEGTFDGLGPLDDDLFYIPTAERLDESAGRDWY